MAKNYKDEDKLTLIGQTPNASNLVINQPIDRNVAGLHNTGVTPTTPEGFEGSSKAVYTHNDSQGSVKDQMNANSKLWWDAKAAGDTDWMKSLEAANQQLAGLLGDGVNYNPSSGTWSGVADMPATMQASMTTGINPQLPTYESAYNAKIDQLMNEMLSREKFSYNAESDPLFQQYKNIYTREGNRSMNDTLAAAASGAGGMSSYAMTAAQQANNYYMAQLGDKIPELQQLAYEMYMNDLGQQRQDINMLLDKDSYDYSKYRDQMADYKWGTEFNYGASRDKIADQRYDQEWAYGLERDKIADERYKTEWEYGLTRDQIEDMWREKQWNYNAGQDQTADERYAREEAYNRAMDMFSMGVMPDSNLLRAAGISEDKAQEILNGMYIGGDDPTSIPDDAAIGSAYGSIAGFAQGASEPISDPKLWSSAFDLGIGPRSAGYLLDLAEHGGLIENADGSLQWAPGWNAENYEEKLKLAKERGSSPSVLLPQFP